MDHRTNRPASHPRRQRLPRVLEAGHSHESRTFRRDHCPRIFLVAWVAYR